MIQYMVPYKEKTPTFISANPNPGKITQKKYLPEIDRAVAINISISDSKSNKQPDYLKCNKFDTRVS